MQEVSTFSYTFQGAAIFLSFLAVIVYGVVAFKFLKLPSSFAVFGVGLCFNALQKLTLYLAFAWNWVSPLDEVVFPFGESLCYAVGSVLLLLHHKRAIDFFDARVREHFSGKQNA